VRNVQPLQSPALARQTAPQPDAVIGADVVIGPYAVIYAGCEIGDGTLIGDHASIREGVRIGKGCIIGQGASVQYDCRIGDRVRILGGCQIATCEIGDDTFIGPNVTFTNDRHIDPLDYRYQAGEAPVVGKRVVIGAGAVVLAGVTIGDGAVVAAGAVVVGHVAPGQTVKGVPAR